MLMQRVRSHPRITRLGYVICVVVTALLIFLSCNSDIYQGGGDANIRPGAMGIVPKDVTEMRLYYKGEIVPKRIELEPGTKIVFVKSTSGN